MVTGKMEQKEATDPRLEAKKEIYEAARRLIDLDGAIYFDRGNLGNIRENEVPYSEIRKVRDLVNETKFGEILYKFMQGVLEIQDRTQTAPVVKIPALVEEAKEKIAKMDTRVDSIAKAVQQIEGAAQTVGRLHESLDVLTVLADGKPHKTGEVFISMKEEGHYTSHFSHNERLLHAGMITGGQHYREDMQITTRGKEYIGEAQRELKEEVEKVRAGMAAYSAAVAKFMSEEPKPAENLVRNVA